MSGSSEQLKDEFVKLIDYLAKGYKLGNGVYGSPNRIPGRPGTDTSPSGKDVSNLDFLSDKLEQDLISLLGEYDINKRSKTNLDSLLSELETYFGKNKKVPFKHVNSLIKSIDKSKTNLESVLELLNMLKNNYLASSLGSATPQLTYKQMINKRSFKETSPPCVDSFQSDELLSSQLRELYYSPLPMEEEKVESQSPQESMFDLNHDNEESKNADLVMDMIYVLKGMEPKHFKKVGDNYFLTSSNLKLSRDMRHLTNRICTFAKMYHSIKSVNFPKSPVMDALFHAIIEELEGFNKLIDLLFLNFGDEYISLLQLYSLLHRPYRKLRLIYNLVNSLNLSLQIVYDNTFRGDVLSRDLFTRILRKSLVPFFEAIYKWLYLGELPSKNTGTNDFFVSESENSCNDYGDDDFYFNQSKVFKFFPKDLAKSIFQKGRLSHYLKRLRKRTSPSVNFKTFLESVVGEHNWSLDESLRVLNGMVSNLNYSVDLATVLKDEYELSNYFTTLCCQFVYFHAKENDFKKYMKPSFDMTEAFEQNLMTFYPNPKFPYTLVIGNYYDFYNNMIQLSALFRVSVDKLNQVFSEYLSWNKYNKGVLELSPFFNKMNFYRSEMVNFLFSLQPFTDVHFQFQNFLKSLDNCTDLDDLRSCNSNFINSLMNKELLHELFPEFLNLLKNVIDFSNCLYDVYKQDMNRLRSFLDSTDPDELVKLIDNELVDYSTSWSCIKSAELFRDNVLKILNKICHKNTLLDFNDYYKFNYRLKQSANLL